MVVFGLALLFVVVVIVFGFPSLTGNGGGSSDSLSPCKLNPQDVVLPFGVDSTAGRWEALPPFPIAQDELRAAAVGNRIYVGGGLRQSGSDLVSTDVFFAFDPERSTYHALPPMPRRIDHPAWVAAGGYLYVIGGFRDWRATAEVYRYSPRSLDWTELPPMSVPRGSPAAAEIGGRIYVAGGAVRAPARKPTDVVEVFDPATSRWSRGPDMPTARHHAGAAGVDGDLYVLGGRSEDDLSLDVVERFDPRTKRWEQAPPLPLGVGAPAGVRSRGRVVAISGGDDREAWVTPAVWSLDPRTGRWQRLADLRVPRHGHAAAVVGNEIYVFGGAPCPGYGRTDSVEKLTVGR
jgi:N-acetylneuraminic acid mutarotase